MKLHYKGKYDLDPKSLPCLSHEPGAVPFKEAENSKTLSLIANGLSLFLLAIFLLGLFLRWGFSGFDGFLAGSVLSLVCAFPHELLHAVCFREDVYLYTNLQQGMLFVVGPERMSKGRFVLMSLLPNLLFGAIPYVIGFVFPIPVIGVFGALSLSMGAGDYYNVYNALTQMPKGARTYLHQFHSYWYLPADKSLSPQKPQEP